MANRDVFEPRAAGLQNQTACVGGKRLSEVGFRLKNHLITGVIQDHFEAVQDTSPNRAIGTLMVTPPICRLAARPSLSGNSPPIPKPKESIPGLRPSSR